MTCATERSNDRRGAIRQRHRRIPIGLERGELERAPAPGVERLEATELAIANDPLARQSDVEREAGKFKGERTYGSAANLPPTRAHKPTDADMGPHNWGGGEAKPKRR